VFVLKFNIFTYNILKMGFFGSLLGQGLGKLGENFLGKTDGIDGSTLGGSLGGSLLPFKTGGAVGGKKGKPRAILAHGGEYVLPANAKPTKAQRAIVARNKRNAKKK
jgi:hypothetical protein